MKNYKISKLINGHTPSIETLFRKYPNPLIEYVKEKTTMHSQLKCKTCGVALAYDTYYYDDYTEEEMYFCENEECMQDEEPKCEECQATKFHGAILTPPDEWDIQWCEFHKPSTLTLLQWRVIAFINDCKRLIKNQRTI